MNEASAPSNSSCQRNPSSVTTITFSALPPARAGAVEARTDAVTRASRKRAGLVIAVLLSEERGGSHGAVNGVQESVRHPTSTEQKPPLPLGPTRSALSASLS